MFECVQLSKFSDLPPSGAKKLEEVTQERDSLRHMVHEMRAHMERLQAEVRDGDCEQTRKDLKKEEFKHSVASGAKPLQHFVHFTKGLYTMFEHRMFSEYVSNLEKELTALKRKHRQLELDLESAKAGSRSDSKEGVTSEETEKKKATKERPA